MNVPGTISEIPQACQ